MKQQSQFSGSDFDFYEDCGQKHQKPEYLSRNKNKVVTMLEKFDQETINLLKKYLDQHRYEAQAAAKYRQACIQKGDFMSRNLRKNSLYQNIQFIVILYNFFSKVSDQVKKKKRSWGRQMMKNAAEQIKSVFAEKFYRKLQISTIMRNMAISHDLTPQIFRYCVEKQSNIVRDRRTHRIIYPNKSDLKALYNPLKQKIKSQKNNNKVKQRECIIIQDQQLLKYQNESNIKVSIEGSVESIKYSRKEKRISEKNKVITISDQQKTNSQRHTMKKVKIQDQLDNSLRKNKTIKLESEQNQYYQGVGLQPRSIEPAFLKVQIQNSFEHNNPIIQENSQNAKNDLTERNDTASFKVQSHNRQGDNLSMSSKIAQEQFISGIKKILLTNSKKVNDQKKIGISDWTGEYAQSCGSQKQVYSLGIQKKAQRPDNQKKESKIGTLKIAIASILLDLLNELD